MRSLAAILALTLLGSLAAPRARAQDAATRARAAEHFDRGIAFYEERRYDAALAELARAHELAPAPATLYNLARVHAALGHAVEASRAYARYLEEASEQIDARRLREVEQALEAQRARIGHLVVVTDVRGATLTIDGVDVATTPLDGPIELSAGAHLVELRAAGRESVRRAVAIAGRSETRLEVELREEVVPRGSLRITSTLPETIVEIDGDEVGATPLAATLPLRAGAHTVTARRAGYRTETRRVEIEEGAEVELHFELRRDPAAPPEHLGRVRLRLPNAPYLVRVDGETVLGLDLELPVGAHVVSIEVTDRRPYEGTIRVQGASGIDVAPALTWTLDARTARERAASELRAAGMALTVAGGVVGLGMVGVLAWNETEIARTDSRLLTVNEELARCREMGWGPACDAYEAEGRTLERDQEMQNVLRGVSVATIVVGVLLGGTGVVLWASAPSDEAIDAGARARLRLGPGALALDGAF